MVKIEDREICRCESVYSVSEGYVQPGPVGFPSHIICASGPGTHGPHERSLRFYIGEGPLSSYSSRPPHCARSHQSPQLILISLVRLHFPLLWCWAIGRATDFAGQTTFTVVHFGGRDLREGTYGLRDVETPGGAPQSQADCRHCTLQSL